MERGELKFEPANNTELSFSHKELRKNVKIRSVARGTIRVSWIVDDGRLLPKNMRRILKLKKFYRDEGYLDIKVAIGHGADKVLTSPEYETLRTKLFQARASHAQAMEDFDDAERRLGNAGADDDEREPDRLVEVAEDRLDDAEDALDDAEDEFEDYLDEVDRVAFVLPLMKALSIWSAM